MFVFIFIAVTINHARYGSAARWSEIERKGLYFVRFFGRLNWYTVVGLLMLASAEFFFAHSSFSFRFVKAGIWDHWVIGVEASQIILFAAFWLFQTIHTWHSGLGLTTEGSSEQKTPESGKDGGAQGYVEAV
jgi:hypothetical protein